MKDLERAASPAYLDAIGQPEHPRDLLGHACIRQRFLSGTYAPWEFERRGKTVRVGVSGPLCANTPELQAGTAIAGSA